MADYFYSLQALLCPDTIDTPANVMPNCCLVCQLANEENQ